MLNGLTEAETSATASVMGLVGQGTQWHPASYGEQTAGNYVAAASEQPAGEAPHATTWSGDCASWCKACAAEAKARGEGAAVPSVGPTQCKKCKGVLPVGDYMDRCGAGMTTLCNCSAAPAGAPPGWKLVPIEPTDLMVGEGSCAQSLPGPHYISTAAARECWGLMLSASPAASAGAPASQPEGGERG